MLMNLERRSRRKGGRETERRGRERERLIDCLPTRDGTHSLGMCPDWGLNLQPLGIGDDVPTN